MKEKQLLKNAFYHGFNNIDEELEYIDRKKEKKIKRNKEIKKELHKRKEEKKNKHREE